jgi:hypothetical protein
MFTRADIPTLAIAAVTALGAGVGLGAWATAPAALTTPAVRSEVQPIYGDDPNLALYKQMIAEQGGPGPLSIAASDPPAAPVTVPDETAAAEAEIARAAAAFEAQAKTWEAERTAWLDAQHRAEQARVPLPVAYAQPELLTTDAAPAADPAAGPG